MPCTLIHTFLPRKWYPSHSGIVNTGTRLAGIPIHLYLKQGAALFEHQKFHPGRTFFFSLWKANLQKYCLKLFKWLLLSVNLLISTNRIEKLHSTRKPGGVEVISSINCELKLWRIGSLAVILYITILSGLFYKIFCIYAYKKSR